MTQQQSFYEQLTAQGVPSAIAHNASIDLADGFGAADSEAIAQAYEYIVPQLGQSTDSEQSLELMEQQL